MEKLVIMMGLASALFAGCQSHGKLEVTVENPSELAQSGKVVELSADSLLSLLGSGYCYVTDEVGNEIPSQITYDTKLIFPVSVAAGGTAVYYIHPSDTLHTYGTVVAGRLYPERADDVAWENELVGFRIYGPGTQAKGERSFGYDLFLKYHDKGLVVEKLYEPETNPATWIKRDSLAAIDPALAEEFVKSFSYHLDHGLGMDCYAVGATLGAGVAAFIDNDSISFPWCYSKAEVLDNGPLRFTVSLKFAPRMVGNDTITEHRLISLDSGSHLNSCAVWFEGMAEGKDIVVGFPLRDESSPMVDAETGVLAYADPTQGPDNGKALVGIVGSAPANEAEQREGHTLLKYHLNPGDTLTYNWGFAWDCTDIKDLDSWTAYLKAIAQNPTLSVSMSNR